MTQPLLSLKEVSLHYDQVQALSCISLDVFDGERVALVGSNGAGKSSLLDVISGIVKPSGGSLFFAQQCITKASIEKRVDLGVMRTFQRSRLFPQFSVLEHLRCVLRGQQLSFWQRYVRRYAFWREMKGNLDEEKRLQDIAHNLDLPLHTMVAELNYAHQRLLEVAMMLVGDAKLLLLDEPTAGLSQTETELFLKHLHTYTQGKAIIFIEHDAAVVRALADRVVTLEHGKIAQDEKISAHTLKDKHVAQS